MSATGIVIIGRNEGERLLRCIDSVGDRGHPVVYVDSGSADGSVGAARARGVEVVELDMSALFTAARARNAGFERLRRIDPSVRFVQFVDGDCEIVEGWLDLGARALEARPDVAVVCGRLRERSPGRSIYNRLADLEWDLPAGEARSCGGIAMIRAASFRQAGGFDPTIIAAEDDELCIRLRQRGGRVLRLDAEMALHDMAMTRFGQWWRRNVRAGHAFAEGTARHGRPPERHFVPQARSAALWGLLVPAAIVAPAWSTSGASLALLAGYGLLFARIARGRCRRGDSARDARLYALFCVLGKFPQAFGLLRYWAGRLSGRRSGIIEHKEVDAPMGATAAR